MDRIILRIGTWELLYNDDVPDGVAVSEAVALAKTLSTDESPSFINGLLGPAAAAEAVAAGLSPRAPKNPARMPLPGSWTEKFSSDSRGAVFCVQVVRYPKTSARPL